MQTVQRNILTFSHAAPGFGFSKHSRPTDMSRPTDINVPGFTVSNAAGQIAHLERAH
jgi:hypothetical protein